MNSAMLKKVENDQYMKRPTVNIGDTIKLHMKIKEGDKERVQIFEGIVIAEKGSGMGKTITVRKISFGIGVEKIIPLNSPTLVKITVVKRGKVRRAKLYYMRDQIGKKAMKVAESSRKVKEEVEEVVSEVKSEDVSETSAPNENRAEEVKEETVKVDEPSIEAQTEEKKEEVKEEATSDKAE